MSKTCGHSCGKFSRDEYVLCEAVPSAKCDGDNTRNQDRESLSVLPVEPLSALLLASQI